MWSTNSSDSVLESNQGFVDWSCTNMSTAAERHCKMKLATCSQAVHQGNNSLHFLGWHCLHPTTLTPSDGTGHKLFQKIFIRAKLKEVNLLAVLARDY